MNEMPLAVQLYGANVRHDYPCGCEFSVNEDGVYTDYVNQDCHFDRNKIGLVRLGHHYVEFNAPTGKLNK